MTRKNQTPKEFLLTILNEHIKFLKRLKNRIPEKYHNYIEEEENRTRSYHANVTKKVYTDYDTLKNEFEKVKKTFNKKIKTLEREIRRLNGVIRKKDKDIEMLQSENEKLEEAINTQAQHIFEKDQQIEELEDKMEGLRFENSNLNNKLNELTESQNKACLKSSNKMRDVEIQKVEIRKTWNDILDNTDVFLAIISCLSPKDLFYLMRVQSYLYNTLKSNHDITQSIWRVSRQIHLDQNFECPTQLTEQYYCFLKVIIIRCQFCENLFNDPVLIIELKIKICRQCIDQVLISHLKLENDQNFPSELIPAIYSVDIEQLQGKYMDFTIRDHPSVSHMVFFLRKDVSNTYEEYINIPNNLRQDWIFHKLKNLKEYQIGVLKMKHPSIFTDQNFNDILSRTPFLIPDRELSLNDFLQCIRSF